MIGRNGLVAIAFACVPGTMMAQTAIDSTSSAMTALQPGARIRVHISDGGLLVGTLLSAESDTFRIREGRSADSSARVQGWREVGNDGRVQIDVMPTPTVLARLRATF